ncbi:unnamed protein product [Owenia fusiformis]|uniref:Uncharacterized protein n=1 Tax=Owenia fusiformis TaxID=6347 RepID=A0A8J1UWS2_OWEFU|nr:unnamed protein product [Owenia fusiformis]
MHRLELDYKMGPRDSSPSPTNSPRQRSDSIKERIRASQAGIEELRLLRNSQEALFMEVRDKIMAMGSPRKMQSLTDGDFSARRRAYSDGETANLIIAQKAALKNLKNKQNIEPKNAWASTPRRRSASVTNTTYQRNKHETLYSPNRKLQFEYPSPMHAVLQQWDTAVTGDGDPSPDAEKSDVRKSSKATPSPCTFKSKTVQTLSTKQSEEFDKSHTMCTMRSHPEGQHRDQSADSMNDSVNDLDLSMSTSPMTIGSCEILAEVVEEAYRKDICDHNETGVAKKYPTPPDTIQNKSGEGKVFDDTNGYNCFNQNRLLFYKNSGTLANNSLERLRRLKPNKTRPGSGDRTIPGMSSLRVGPDANV